MTFIVVILYLIIAFTFFVNLASILKHLKNGSKKVNRYSVIATSSLIVQSLLLSARSYTGIIAYELFAQIYLLICMFYIRYLVKNKNK